MYLMYYLDTDGKRVYTLKVSSKLLEFVYFVNFATDINNNLKGISLLLFLLFAMSINYFKNLFE